LNGNHHFYITAVFFVKEKVKNLRSPFA